MFASPAILILFYICAEISVTEFGEEYGNPGKWRRKDRPEKATNPPHEPLWRPSLEYNILTINIIARSLK